MKRIVSVFAMTILSLTVLAQSQHGYVKTRGRMVNGQHVHGNPLPGAVVNLYGRTAVGVQNEDGSFSFPVILSFRACSLKQAHLYSTAFTR